MSGPTRDGVTAVVDPSTGRVVQTDNANLDAVLKGGFRLADDAEIQAERDRQQYGEGLGNELAAFGEGALSGATIGLSDVAAKYVAPEYAEGLAKRREHNALAAGLGEGAGILGATLLTGGLAGEATLAARGAQLATAPARLLLGAGEAVTAGAGRLLGAEAATGVLGQAVRQGAALGLGGATEGALFGAAKAVTDDYLNGVEHDTMAERIMVGAKGALEGGLYGAGFGAGLGVTGSLLGSAGRKVASVWNRSDAEREATRIADEAIEATAGAGTSAEAEIAAQTLTGDQKVMHELGYRSEDNILAELELNPTSAEQQTAFAKLREMGAEAAAARDYRRLQQDYTKSISDRVNSIAGITEEVGDQSLNRSFKRQAVRDQLDVVAPEWTRETVEGLVTDVRATRQRFEKLRNDTNLFKEHEHGALQDVIDGANEVERLLTGVNPEPIERLERGVRTYKVDDDAVREALAQLDASVADDGGQHVMRYVPIKDIDTTARPVQAGAIKRITSKTTAPPVLASVADDGKYLLQDGAQRLAAAKSAGMSHVPVIVREAPGGVLGANGLDAIADGFIAFDDFKGYLGRAAKTVGRKSPVVGRAEDAIWREYMGYRGKLESEALLGEGVATMQRMTNAAESEAIRTRRVFENRFAQADSLQNVRAGKYGQDTLATVDRKSIGSLLNDLGKAENADVERDFMVGLERMVDNMETKMRFYRLSPEKRARVAQARQEVQSILSDLRTLKATKEMADRYADEVAAYRDVPFVGEQLAKLKVTGSKAVQFASELAAGQSMTASGGRAVARSAAGSAIRTAIRGEESIGRAGRGIVAWLRKAGQATGEAAGKAGRAITRAAKSGPLLGVSVSVDKPATVEQLIRNIGAMQDPRSDERRAMRVNAFPLRRENPRLAQALEAHTQRVADFLADKAGDLSAIPKVGDPFGQLRGPRHSAVKAAKLARYVDAATNPAGAMERIGKGDVVREDVEVLQALYPRLYQRMVNEVLMNLSTVDELPSYEARVRLSHLLNAPADPSMRPERAAALQQLARTGAQPDAQEQSEGVGQPVLSPSQRRPPQKLGQMYATQVDRQATGGAFGG